MVQEDKALLLKDLCARLPYGVKVNGVFLNYNKDKGKILYEECVKELDYNHLNRYETLKPYLFPLSSMTEEQLHELKDITAFRYNRNTLELVKWTETHKTLEFWLEEAPQYEVVEVFDWLNKNHFDYRGLIEKGLAIDCTNLDIY